MTKSDIAAAVYAGLQREIADVVESTREATARNINALMTATYWEIGRRIVEFEQGGEGRAAYGEALIKRLGADLSQRFGRGFGWRNLSQMRAFYLSRPAEQILQTLSAKSPSPKIVPTLSAISAGRHLSGSPARNFPDLAAVAQAFRLPWSAYVRLLSLRNPAARSFYEAGALRCGWSVRQLDREIGSQFYERVALSHNKAAMLRKAGQPDADDAPTPEQAIRDPFVLEFLDLKDEYSESDLEDGLIFHLTDCLHPGSHGDVMTTSLRFAMLGLSTEACHDHCPPRGAKTRNAEHPDPPRGARPD
ncbi:Protein of unknown function [Burkholderia sp. WP9]|uniref:DUF1016 N-terminal domain-containing protein n=1 Tax=Burkholderia sp. WP9 TaxID=1500263 RepID=UPI0008990B8B|nr:Protein of unknown function [Burkholderia sp. WP9]